MVGRPRDATNAAGDLEGALIGLVLSMIRARPWPALTAFLLATFAMAAAVRAPVYTVAADRAVVAGEVAGASTSERVVQARRVSRPGDRDFEQLAVNLFVVPGFRTVFSTEFDSIVESDVPGAEKVAPRLVYRDDVCEHLRFRSGRCAASTSEVILSQDAVDTLKVKVGDQVGVRWATLNTQDGEWIPAVEDRVQVTVVGVYQPLDKGEQYWADLDYFNDTPTARGVSAPLFTGRLTTESIEHGGERQAMDVVIDGSAITGESLATVSSAVDDARLKLTALPDGPVVHTDLPALLTRIDTNRKLVSQVVPIAAVPLVLLSWFVLFIAVASATQERRLELGLLSLRGVAAPRRWWLAAGESLLPILLGSAAGFLLGHLVVRLAAALLLSRSASVPLSAGADRWALAAVLGALLAALLAHRAELAKRTIDLLRNVPSRLARWQAPVLEVSAVLLAAVAVVQLRQGGAGLTGFAVFAPSGVVIAVALLAARAVVPLAERTGRRALRQGRLGPALGAYALSRRPGSQRVLALFVVAVALLCFAATATDVSRGARDERVRVELGAPRVLSVALLTRSALLGKVRALDPEGRFAMAAARLPPSDDAGVPPMLAVDSPRLARVALWDDTKIDVRKAVELLRPQVARQPIMVDNKDLSLDLTMSDGKDAFRVRLIAVVQPIDGSATGHVDLGALQSGRHTYTRNLPMCVDGCRLVDLQVDQPEGRGFDITMTMHQLGQQGRTIADEAGFRDTSAWRTPESPGPALLVPTLSAAPDGLRVELTGSKGGDVAVKVLPTDTPSPLPVVMARTAGLGDHVAGLDSSRQSVQDAGDVPAVPKLGTAGGLVDFEYADRLATRASDAVEPEIWLNDDAPANVLDLVREQGLVVTGDRDLSVLRKALAEQGPAVALRFHELAAAFAVLLAAGALWMVAGLDRHRRTAELRSLRIQGVPRREATTSGYLALVGTAVLIGPFAALISWLLVGRYLPTFADDPGTIPVSYWPSPIPVAAFWLVSALVLGGVALLASARLRAATETDRNRTTRRTG